MIKSIAFSFSENRGKLLENLVFLALRKSTQEIYYYTTKNNLEVDFYLPKQKILIQVCQTMVEEETQTREVGALEEARKELNIDSAIILTEDDGDITTNDIKIKVISIYEWLLR